MKISAILLAAGRSTRMGDKNKLLVDINGKPMVRHVAENLLNSKIDDVLVVTGHMADEVRGLLEGLSLRFIHNEEYQDGLSTSLKAGIAALKKDIDAALIVLGDMPFIETQAFDKILEAYKQKDGEKIVVASFEGKRGNPVLWPRCFFEDLTSIEGDKGARELFKKYGEVLEMVEIGKAASLDIDTPEMLSSVLKNL